MNYKGIDDDFDRAIERIERKGAPLTDAYGTSPLASDHHLLKKSWDYFRSRVRMIEDHWRKMLEAKDVQLKTSLAEAANLRQEKLELEEENRMLRALDHSIKKARTEDHLGFAKKAESLRIHWDNERDALLRKISSLEMKIAQQKKDLETKMALALARDAKLKETIQGLTKDAAAIAERERDLQNRWMGELKQKDDRILSLETKIELLRGEVSRRDQVLKKLETAVFENEKDAHAMTQYVAELQRALRDRDTEIKNLKTQYDILMREKDGIREGWERERAEWRELWDRGREAWEKRR